MRMSCLVAICLALTASPLFAANLLVNGDFETYGAGFGNPAAGDTTYVPGWTIWQPRTSQKTIGLVGTDSYNGGSAPHSGNYAFTCYSKSSWSGGVYQEVAVTPGTMYQLDGWWKGYSDSGGGYWVEVGVINGAWNQSIADGGTSSTIWKQTVQYFPNPNSSPSAYNQLSTEPFLSNGLGTNQITAISNVMTVWIKSGQANTGLKTRVRVDDMVLTAVPEPASILALLGGLAGLAGAIRRRK